MPRAKSGEQGKGKGKGRATGPTAQLKSRMEALPKEVRRESWQIRFLTEELRGASTEVERGVILDWLTRAKERRAELESDLERCRSEYRELRGRRTRTRRAAAGSAS